MQYVASCTRHDAFAGVVVNCRVQQCQQPVASAEQLVQQQLQQFQVDCTYIIVCPTQTRFTSSSRCTINKILQLCASESLNVCMMWSHFVSTNCVRDSPESDLHTLVVQSRLQRCAERCQDGAQVSDILPIVTML